MLGCIKIGTLSGLVLVAFTASFCVAITDPRDVVAMNSLWVSLNFPPLLGWLPGGDPCGEEWQGVSCVFSNITALKLSGMNLGGTLADDLALFESIIEIDLSNNHIGGSIPSSLPPTLRIFSLAGNQFNGSIPDTLSTLTQLSHLSINDNHLSGEMPDAFQQLTSLTNLDLSGNNLSGQLPPSLGNLSSLSSLHLQSNKFVGVLDVLQDLPLQDLNVENNLFSGPIPAKLLNIPNFRKDGNPFNTTIIASPPLALSPSPAMPPSSAEAPEKQGYWPSISQTPKAEAESSRAFLTTKRAILVTVAVVVIVIILVLCVLVSSCSKRKKVKEDAERHVVPYKGHIEKPNSKASLQQTNEEKVPKNLVVKLQDQFRLDNEKMETSPKLQDKHGIDPTRMSAQSRNNMDHEIDMNFMALQPPPPPPPCLPVDKVIINPVVPAEIYTRSSSTKNLKSSSSLRVFTIATLQQYTNSFSEENFVGEGTLGSVYKAELPDRKLLAVKKLNSMATRQQTEKEFLDLVSTVSKIRHPNIVELLGYCNEHGQRLLVYEFCETGTLNDALHMDDEIHKKLSWNARIRLALGAARALQYLHEVCEPSIVHQNFRSSNILLDEKLAACVSDCGLAPLQSSSSANELSGRLLSTSGYGAPEFELGSYTCKSDVYSFGVVMLELLTGRKSYDRSRSRGEQSLVRWAIPRLHDIDSLCGMVDPSLNGSYPAKSLSRFADIIARCVQWEPEFRPAMSEIVQDLLRML
ncbi:protein STRUBBELIG-RECEPTOR FAMILY 3 [Ricinus communis]|uniref:protein STRUBBELIG-RECEPTOR FAMILY 3 n=1 Tax=Ricinus communis TaxID=3988 RepID=UPI000772300D|nr:protein STRUBBELIG-RECEPTOR FAMILY 3 [Ricinus communis]XP_015576217.1 protein STRUBBELIG-RECEPTOR FAMILY 3 [Ricinus communis]|eukprot:XP_015576216.1 protein STRUBBELIG-RECEPTOR FAMILY 3 [Ricinus communis]